MQRPFIKYSIILFSILVVGYPILVRATRLNWALDATLIFNLFPIFGILAFGLLWLHVVGAAFDTWLKSYVNFDNFIESTSDLILFAMIMHPVLLLMGLDWDFGVLTSSLYTSIGVLGLGLLLIYDLGRFLNKRDFFIRHWNKILFISTLGFLLIFLHSLGIGSDVQSGHMRIIWIFYGVTGVLATIYNYGLRKYIGR